MAEYGHIFHALTLGWGLQGYWSGPLVFIWDLYGVQLHSHPQSSF